MENFCLLPFAFCLFTFYLFLNWLVVYSGFSVLKTGYSDQADRIWLLFTQILCSMIKDFIDGLYSYGKALQLLSKHKLWGYAIVTGLLSVLLGAGIFSLAWGLSDNLGDTFDNLWRWEWGSEVVAKVAQVFGGLIILVVGLIVFKQLIMVISAPFMSLLSERIENALRGYDASPKFTVKRALYELVRGLRIAIRNIIRELLLTAFLLVLGLIPLFTPFTTVLIFIIQSYYAGFGNMDFTLERHLSYKDSIRFVNRYRGLAIGNGLVFIVALLTFVGFLFVVPLSTAASAVETIKRLEDKSV